MPEVFYEVIRGHAERNNLKCNAYATLRELDAFLMKGDSTLPDKYTNTVKLEFPRVGSSEFEEYNVRPYDFCFLFDAQNTEGKKLNDFNHYLDHAANCIYSQSIASALHKRMKIFCNVPGINKPPSERTQNEKLNLRILEHRRWNAYMRSEGYTYGKEKNNLAKTHPCLVTFCKLNEKEQLKDDE